MAAPTRPLDIVVWGATGTVGKLVAEHVAQNYQVQHRTDTILRFLCMSLDLETDLSDDESGWTMLYVTPMLPTYAWHAN